MPELLYVSDVAPYERAGGRFAAGVHRSLGVAAQAFEEIAGLCGLDYGQATRVSDVPIAALEEARVLVLFTIGETQWSAEQKAVIERRAENGELGVVGIHATTDSAYGWPKFGELIGARFDGHPVTGELPISVVEATHPATAHLPSPWRLKEELYLFRDLSPDVRVLLAVEMGSGGSGEGPSRLPIAWCIERGAMRTFYTVLGHFLSAYEDGNYLEHLRGAVEWVLGNDVSSR